MQVAETANQVRPNWLARAIVSGFVASMVMLFTFIVGYGASALLAGMQLTQRGGAETLGRWLSGLTSNPLIDLARPNLYAAIAIHLAVGLAFAVVYAYFFEPRLRGPSWVRGVAFSLVPWLLSLVVFLPLVGGGFLGLGLGAGPLPMLGNLILHAVYGATLGLLYGPFGDLITSSSFEAPTGPDRAMQGSEQMAARGILVGLVLGAVAGVVAALLAAQAGAQGTVLGIHPLLFVVSTALFGAAFGGLVGSLVGLPAPEEMS